MTDRTGSGEMRHTLKLRILSNEVTMSDILPDPPESSESDEQRKQNESETLQIEDTPFATVPWTSHTSNNWRALEQALELYDEIQMFSEATDDELEASCTPFTWTWSDNRTDPDIVYWRYVAPTLATSPDVEWIGHHGYDDSEGYPSKKELKAIAEERLPERAEKYVAPTAVIVRKIGKIHRNQNGRRVCRFDLSKWHRGHFEVQPTWQTAYEKFVPLMPQIRPANGENEPDWIWRGD